MSGRRRFDPIPSLPVPAKKSSGKVQAYMLWLNDVGRRQFMSLYKEPYNPRNPEHTPKISELYQALSGEDREYYKALEKSSLNDPEVRAQRRKKANELARDFAHQYPELIMKERERNAVEAEKRRKMELLEQVKYGADPSGAIHIATTSNFDPDLCRKSDFLTKRSVDRDRLSEQFKAYDKYDKDQGGYGIATKKFIYIGVTASNCVHSGNQSGRVEIRVVPAEIAIVEFDLLSGLINNTVKFVKPADPAEILNENNPEHSEVMSIMLQQVKHINKEFGIPATSEYNQEPEVVWKSIWKTISSYKDACLVTNASHYQITYFGLEYLADAAGFHQMQKFKSKFHLYTIEDVTFALNLFGGKMRKIDYIECMFTIDKLFDAKVNLLGKCPIHAGYRDIRVETRHRCQLARSCSYVQKLFDFASQHNIGKMVQTVRHNLVVESSFCRFIKFPMFEFCEPRIENEATSMFQPLNANSENDGNRSRHNSGDSGDEVTFDIDRRRNAQHLDGRGYKDGPLKADFRSDKDLEAELRVLSLEEIVAARIPTCSRRLVKVPTLYDDVNGTRIRPLKPDVYREIVTYSDHIVKLENSQVKLMKEYKSGRSILRFLEMQNVYRP